MAATQTDAVFGEHMFSMFSEFQHEQRAFLMVVAYVIELGDNQALGTDSASAQARFERLAEIILEAY